ncbi:UPF0276 protein [Shewanella sp. NFH-SH190041]|uniref:HvfB family MNIO-type RiPP peptide maturase n=1 Tax=Shewanella sp. NFH-SH190041 TaxID=2950245 RepID=UPI0021C3AB24|nr:DUF692 domain-containing protein [Shewanella sp. NFH-SH190041]BDM63936.1 UPF0276 protein [Shewanella sp. NFH-SH190041]
MSTQTLSVQRLSEQELPQQALAGLGLRRDMLDGLLQQVPDEIDFFEIAPENWMTLGGRYARQLKQLSDVHAFFAHGLSLSIGGPAPLDIKFVQQVKDFLQRHGIRYYSEHLSYCSGKGHLYDLMPIPFTAEAVHYVSQRVKQVQDILEQPLILENVSAYAMPGAEMSEAEFIRAVLAESGSELLLDINNIYVNSVNHGYDASAFLRSMPTDKIRYLHIAGHYVEAEDLIVDTHGAAVVDPVWQLLAECYQYHGVFPTLLERDFNIPPMAELVVELEQIHGLQRNAIPMSRRA